MRELRERYGDAVVTFELVVTEILRRTSGFSDFPPGLVQSFVQPNDQGLVWQTLNRQLDFVPVIEHGRDLLRQFLRERAVTVPLARIMSQGRGHSFPQFPTRPASVPSPGARDR